MAKVKTTFKLQIPAGKANPAPPVGPVLGQHGLNIQAFCTEFNDKTKELGGVIIPVVVTVYEDKTFSLELKQPPMAVLIKQELGLKSGSGEPNKTKVAKLTRAQITKIAESKMPDLNAFSLESAERQVEGTARSMGIEWEPRAAA